MKKLIFYVIIVAVAMIAAVVLWPGKSNGPAVLVMAEFENKVVYGVDGSLNQEELKKDCDARGGEFNTCGSVCESEEEICIQVCAFTCELK